MKNNFQNMCKDIFKYHQEVDEHNRKMTIENHLNKFEILESYYDFTHELGKVLDSYIPGKEKPFLQFTLLRIHEKAEKVYKECLILMENGSASGAMARWRTLFEFSVIANILVKYPDLARKYVEYVGIDDYKMAKKLITYKDRLNLSKFNMDAFESIESNYNRLLKKYNWNGRTNNEWSGRTNNEWALNSDIKCTNLFDLAKNVGLEHMYAYVDESQLYIHASMKYLINDRGSKVDNDTYLFTPYEIDLSMQLMVCSLHQVNVAAISGYSSLESANQEQLLSFLKQNCEFPETLIDIIKSNS